ncbi:hypothetical protein PHK61_13135 [Actinomycetospora lutea]|uniref:hypothetical protein n=1 Tax=Actinomycetospora lutea TaxID=663604 RepID=UPI0023666C00|nr:hypothetical protein [Actinomycetospora lutea]MDD7939362.1 hypothetical protein [Actinomycetospora lutea]
MTEQPLPPPLQADSPVTLPDGRTVPRYRPPEVGGGSFTVDLARAPEAIRELETARDELLDIKREAERLGRVEAPTRDLVSIDAAQLLGTVAVGGPGSLLVALDQGIQQIELMLESLRSSLEQYRDSDDHVRADLS